MRRFLATGLLLLAAGAGCGSRPPLEAVAPPPAPAPKVGLLGPDGAPAWIPVYSPQQLALLTPVDHAIETPARRVFPDLQRFWYANNRPLQSPEEALKFTRMIATILSDSPRFYSLDAAAPGLANPEVQYGPPPAEPDGWSVTKRGEGDVGELTPAAATPEARALFAKGEAKARAGDLAGAIAAYQAALATSPRVPAIRMALAAALAKSGNPEAEAACNAAIVVDPTFAPPWVLLAELASKRGDAEAARRAIVEALAYQPSSRAALDQAGRIGAGGHRILPFSIFLDVDTVGAIRVGAAASDPAQMYGGCRAVMRYEPDVRAQIFEQPKETPYYLSVVEEVICLEAALGAYMIERKDDDDKGPDPDLEALLALARDEGLSGYVMFEILGQHRPERARVAPKEVHKAMVRYVERQVFGQKDAPEGVYTAAIAPEIIEQLTAAERALARQVKAGCQMRWLPDDDDGN